MAIASGVLVDSHEVLRCAQDDGTIGGNHAYRRGDVLHRLLHDAGGTRHGAGGTRLRIGVGARALAHPADAQVGMAGRRRAAQEVLRRHGSVRDPDGRGRRHQKAEGRHRRLPGQPARSHPDRQGGGLDRPAFRRALPVRRRQRLEPGRDGEPRHQLREPPQAGARAHRGHEGDLDQVQGRVSRRDGEVRSHDGLAQAGPEAASADPGRRRLSLRRAPRRALRRRLDAAAPAQGL